MKRKKKERKKKPQYGNAGVPQIPELISAISGPKFAIL